MQDFLRSESCRRNSQSEADVAEPAEIRATERVVAEGTADIEEYCATDARESKRVPVGEISLFDGQERATIARLVSQRVATQAAVAASAQSVGATASLLGEVEPILTLGDDSDEQVFSLQE